MYDYLKEKLENLKQALTAAENFDLPVDRYAPVPIPKEALKKVIETMKSWKSPESPEFLATGQLWYTKILKDSPVYPKMGPMIVLLTSVKDGLIKAVPISEEWEFASCEDMLLEENPLNQQIMLQLWAELRIKKESLGGYIGSVTVDTSKAVTHALRWVKGYEDISATPRLIKHESAAGIPIVSWDFISAESGELSTVRLGTRIITPLEARAEYQQMVNADLEYLHYAIFQKLETE